MAEPSGREDGRALALAEELGAQLGRLNGAGPKIKQFLSMVQLERPSDGGRPPAAFGALPEGAAAVPFGRVRKIIEVQHPGVAEAVEADLRTIGLVRPILARLAPELDAGAVLAEIRARISDEVDDELEAEHQRRLRRLLRDHPHVRVPRVQTDLSTRRVLVTEYVERLRSDEIERLGEPERDRISEIAFRCYFDLASRAGVVAGDPHADNCIVCPDGRLCLLDFGLLRDLDMEIQLLALLGAFEAGADWGAITAEHHSGKPASTALGRAQVAFWERRT